MSDLSQKILESARDLYLEHGLHGLSMRKIAEQLNVSATAIYRHYKNKESLIYKVIGEGFTLFGAYLYKALEGKSPLERFQLGGEAYLLFALEQSKYYEVLFMAPEQLGHGETPPDIKSKGEATFQFLIDRVQECMHEGIFQKGDPYKVALSIWAHSHGLVALFLSHKLPMDIVEFKQLFKDSTMLCFLGICSPKGRRLLEQR